MRKYLIILLFCELLIISFICKVFYINTFFIPDNDNAIYISLQILFHDSVIFILIFLLTFLSYLRNINYFLSVLLRLFSLTISIAYVIDLIILNNFTTHLLLEDVIKYFSYIPKYISQEYSLNLLHILIFLFILIFSYLFVFKKIVFENKIFKNSSYFLILVLIPLPFLADNGRYVHSWVFKNFIEYNLQVKKQSTQYSQSFKNNLNYNETKECNLSKELPTNDNIIILMVESLSSYQSKYFSNIKNWTPRLDEIAKQNIAFRNFHANGFMTEDAEISILTGLFPIYPPRIFSDGGGVSFMSFYNIKDSIANILNSHNYQTEFITSSDLDFSNTGNWAKSIGFKYIEGSEHEFYKNKKRYHFNAASDEFLYERVLDRIQNQESKYFFFIKTVSSHVPFTNPENDSFSEEETIKYVDRQIGLFYDELNKIDYFRNGQLIIVGDHHPLIPIKNEQISLHGDIKAPAFVPMIIINRNNNKIINDSYQQTDIYNSIKNSFSQEKCTSVWNGDFYNNIPPKYIVHRRGDNRGVISVFEKNKTYEIILNGDDTSLEDGKINSEILDKINFERIQRDKNRR